MDFKISVIIPLFNCEKYIGRCVLSIVDQKRAVTDVEIIVIDDGSVDDGPRIVRELQTQYPNIVFVQQANRGVSETRNRGLGMATGKYIQFVDADDYIDADFYSTLLSLIEEKEADVYGFKYLKIIDDDGGVQEGALKIPSSLRNRIVSGEDFIKEGQFHHSVCCFLLRRELINQNHIFFKPYVWGEDVLFITELLLKTDRVYVVDDFFYNYILYNNTSATKRKDVEHLRKMAFSYIQVCKELHSLIQNLSIKNVGCYEVIERNIRLFTYFGIIKYLYARTSYSIIDMQLISLKQLGLYPIRFVNLNLPFFHKCVLFLVNCQICIRYYCKIVKYV